MNHDLAPSAVQAALQTKWLGRNYHYYPSIDSTNVALQQMATGAREDKLPVGTTLLADFQTKGRGRLGRSWTAPPATSLLFSCLFRPNWPARQGHWLTIIASLAAAEAIEAITTLNVSIKWPNDLLVEVDERWHKVSGILLHAIFDEQDRLGSGIVGIGINVNIPHDQLPRTTSSATSLLAATGRPVSRLQLLANLLLRLEVYYESAERSQSPRLAWKERLINLGHPVEVTSATDQPTLIGIAEDIDDWGHLVIRDAAGWIHTVTAGDVTLTG